MRALCGVLACAAAAAADDGYDAWLRYSPLPAAYAAGVRISAVAPVCAAAACDTAVLDRAAAEASAALSALLARSVPVVPAPADGALSLRVAPAAVAGCAAEGFSITTGGGGGWGVAGADAAAVLRGVFRLAARLQQLTPPADIAVPCDAPALQLRMWDLWDNLGGNIERGYGGNSVLWPAALHPANGTGGALIKGTQTYNPTSGIWDSALCFTSQCLGGNGKGGKYVLRAEGWAIPAGDVGADGKWRGMDTVPLNNFFDPGLHSNWLTNHSSSSPPAAGYKWQSLQAAALRDPLAEATVPLVNWYSAEHHDHVAVATDAGRKWARDNGYSPGETIGHLFTDPAPPGPAPAEPWPARFVDMARLLASVGINGLVLNNVNACSDQNRVILSSAALAAIAQTVYPVFSSFGVRVYVSICFASPTFADVTGGKTVPTADPLDSRVVAWWKDKAAEIYKSMPGFGGFLVKADSEGQPGPDKYGRTQADGANVLARALAPHGGLCIWRAFVYGHDKLDRAVQAYKTFKPLDGSFDDNAVVQVKNGPMDFQVREPLSSILGALNRTNVMMEVQAAQEYTGQQIHVCSLVPQWSSYLGFDTQCRGPGSTVARLLAKQVWNMTHSGIAAVSNLGDDRNWTGHVLAQANTYGFGRLAWDPSLPPDAVHREWAALTFGAPPPAGAAGAGPTGADLLSDTVVSILNDSWGVLESYSSPFGMNFVCEGGYGGGPCPGAHGAAGGAPRAPPSGERRVADRPGASHYWVNPVKDVLYHNASRDGVGCNRNSGPGGTGYSAEFPAAVRDAFDDADPADPSLLLFFHHVPYNRTLRATGKTLIRSLYDLHIDGVRAVDGMVARWAELEPPRTRVDPEMWRGVAARLAQQLRDAATWRDAYNKYFEQLSGVPVDDSLAVR